MGVPNPSAPRQVASRILRIFSRRQGKTIPPAEDGDSARPPASPPEDKSWTAGDQAECINEIGWGIPANIGLIRAPGPSKGQIFIVAHVMMLPHPNRGKAIFLAFRGCNGFWEATQFRKLQPVADKAEAADGAFVQDLRDRLARQPERV